MAPRLLEAHLCQLALVSSLLLRQAPLPLLPVQLMLCSHRLGLRLHCLHLCSQRAPLLAFLLVLLGGDVDAILLPRGDEHGLQLVNLHVHLLEVGGLGDLGVDLQQVGGNGCSKRVCGRRAPAAPSTKRVTPPRVSQPPCLQGRQLPNPQPPPPPHLRLVFYVLGTVGVVQRAQRFLLALHCGGDGGDDASLGLAAQRVAQQAGELGVTVGHVALPLHQRCDHAAQRQQRLVDVACLLGSLVHRARSAGVVGGCCLLLR